METPWQLTRGPQGVRFLGLPEGGSNADVDTVQVIALTVKEVPHQILFVLPCFVIAVCQGSKLARWRYAAVPGEA